MYFALIPIINFTLGGANFNQEVVSQLLQEAMGDGTAHTNLMPSWSR